MKDYINNLTHSLLQQGEEIRQYSYGAAPSATKDLTTTSSGDGRAIRSDAKNQPLHPQQLLMVLEQPMPVHLELQLLLSLLGVSIKRKFVSIKERETMLQEFTNQCPC
jgi:hypothetical protein